MIRQRQPTMQYPQPHRNSEFGEEDFAGTRRGLIWWIFIIFYSYRRMVFSFIQIQTWVNDYNVTTQKPHDHLFKKSGQFGLASLLPKGPQNPKK